MSWKKVGEVRLSTSKKSLVLKLEGDERTLVVFIHDVVDVMLGEWEYAKVSVFNEGKTES